jgi:hypothetical protein
MRSQRKLKVFLLIATLMFVVKPFIGFLQFSKQHPPAKVDVFELYRVFGKRILQNRDGSLSAMTSVQKQIADPELKLHVTFSSLLLFLFPLLFIFESKFLSNCKIKRDLQSSPVYLLNRQFLV